MPVVNQQVDTAAPTINITSDKSALNSSETAIVTFDLSESSTDFTLEDIEVTGGDLSELSGSGDAYTATFTPKQGISENATFKVLSGSFTDIAGNDNTHSELQIPVDTIAPTVSIAMADSVLAMGESTEVTFTFSEQVGGVDGNSISDYITAENGTLSNFAPVTSLLAATEDGSPYSNPSAAVYNYDVVGGSIIFQQTQIYTNTIPRGLSEDMYTFRHEGGAITFDIASRGLDINGDGATGDIDVVLRLLDSNGNDLKVNDDSRFNSNVDGSEASLLEPEYSLDSLLEINNLEAGEYQLKVQDQYFVPENIGVNSFSSNPDYQLTIVTENDAVTDVKVTQVPPTVTIFTATYTPDANVTDVENVISIDMTSIEDSAGNIGVGNQESSENFKVDTIAPTVDAASVAASGAQNNTLNTGDEVTVTVNFTEPVVVTGIPTIKLAIGVDDIGDPVNVEATYSGEGALLSEHKFTYIILEGQTDADGISVVANSLANSQAGTIKDATGNDANLSNLSVINNSEMKVDAVASKVTEVHITSDEIEFNVLSVGDIIKTIVHFDEDVFVTGTPSIWLELDNGTESPREVEATYSGNGGLSNALTFSYVVAVGDIDTSGISVVKNSLGLGAADANTILDAAGNAALLYNPKVDSDPDMLVDTIAPQLNVSDSKPTVSFDSETNTIEVTVTFSEGVTLKDGATATLTVLVNNDTNDVLTPVLVTAIGYGTNSQSLVFKSTVLTDGLFDTNTVQVQTNSLNYAPDSLFDQAGNLVPKDFDEIDVALDVPIDTRANREIKQEEAYTEFSKLLKLNPGDNGALNKILDYEDKVDIGGVDTITGGQGLDQIFGSDANEHLIGGEGIDFLKGGGGNDLLDGGKGNDYLYADAGDDTVRGGEGNDTILFNKLTVDGNQLVLDLFKDVTAQAANSELGTNTISGIENAIGTNKGDVIDGNGYDNFINGADGEDLINGGRGDDTLLGGTGNDVLKGGRGNDTLEGGKGADQLYGGSGQDTFVFDLNDDLLTDAADVVFDFSHYADKIRILSMEDNQSVEILNGTLSIKTEAPDSEASTSLELATGFDTRLEYSHLVLEFTQPELV
jgi:Ca2+-binding RTX toxin-like protein